MSGTGTKSITISGADYFERVVPGWDVELGYRLPFYPRLAFYLKGFNWDYRHRNDNSGMQSQRDSPDSSPRRATTAP